MRVQVYARSPDVLWRTTADRVVLRPLYGDGLVSLTGSGTTLWALLAAPISFEHLVEAMAAHYHVAVDVVRDSVATALSDMERVNLVVRDVTDEGPHNAVPAQGAGVQAAQ